MIDEFVGTIIKLQIFAHCLVFTFNTYMIILQQDNWLQTITTAAFRLELRRIIPVRKQELDKQ